MIGKQVKQMGHCQRRKILRCWELAILHPNN